MLRMIVLQMAFQFFAARKSIPQKTKAILIGLVCAYFLYSDLSTFMQRRNPNLYNLIGIDRNSNATYIEDRLSQALNCSIEISRESCESFPYTEKYMLNTTEIDEIRYMLVKRPNLRELYDKTEIFIRKNLEKTIHNPSQGTRYLSAFKDLGSFSMFMVMMAVVVDKHQNFAKQVVISSLLVFASFSF